MNTIELKQACFVELEQIPKEKLQEVLSYLKQLRQNQQQKSDEPKLGEWGSFLKAANQFQIDDAPADWAKNIDNYLYKTPNNE